MLVNLSERPDFPLIWDSTMRGSFVSCPRKFMYEFLFRLAPRKVSIHLHFGACFARGLEDFRKVFYDTNSTLDLRERYDAALAAGIFGVFDEWGEYELEYDDPTPKTLENCLLAFDAYLQNWNPATDYVKPYQAATGPAVEFTFGLPIPEVLHPLTGEPLIYAGRFDMLGEYSSMLYVVDEKTTSQLGPKWAGQWPLRAQFTGYVWAANTFGMDVLGAIVRGTCILKKSFNFGEAILDIAPWQQERWYQQLVRDLQRAVDAWKAFYFDYDLDSTCNAYGGCVFRHLCESQNPQRWVEDRFVIRHWNPLAKDPTADPEEADGSETRTIYKNG